MILDTLENAALYGELGPGFDLAFDYLRSDRPTADPIGRHELDGDRVFVNVERYTSKPADRGRWEAHRCYADVQCVVSGCERIGYAPLGTLAVEQAYDEGSDVAFYKGEGSLVVLEAGMFALFWPGDGHMPGLQKNLDNQHRWGDGCDTAWGYSFVAFAATWFSSTIATFY